MESFKQFLDKAVQTAIVSEAKQQGLRGEELEFYVEEALRNPTTIGWHMDRLMPQEVKQFEADERKLGDLDRAEAMISQLAYTSGNDATQLTGRIRAALPAASEIMRIRNRLESGEIYHYNPQRRARLKNLLDTLVSYGIVSEQQEG